MASGLFTLLSLASALPTIFDAPVSLTIRPGTSADTCKILICSDPNSSGQCVDITGPAADCISIASDIGPQYSSSASTFVIEDGCICTLTDNASCYQNGAARSINLSGSGSTNLNDEGFDNLLQSYICFR
ncbi:hypothetical protein BU16DRAFT_562263 [Lophium mytilinum]|uniref:Uncharacterized protein n=1 Tax=Lophium mytilinum TaxID=390894 RepID=A0A6A6QQE0_9PEZI|nr:hypothetical protein BU16DRAFT_562263 [Lophium mytilinum]